MEQLLWFLIGALVATFISSLWAYTSGMIGATKYFLKTDALKSYHVAALLETLMKKHDVEPDKIGSVMDEFLSYSLYNNMIKGMAEDIRNASQFQKR